MSSSSSFANTVLKEKNWRDSGQKLCVNHAWGGPIGCRKSSLGGENTIAALEQKRGTGLYRKRGETTKKFWGKKKGKETLDWALRK